MLKIIFFLLIGLTAGSLSGLIGIGGGIIIVPALVLLLGFSQAEAQGTTLSLMVLPIGILGAWVYYKQGYVDTIAAALICISFAFGSLLGARFATNLPNLVLQRLFGVVLLIVGLRMTFFK